MASWCYLIAVWHSWGHSSGRCLCRGWRRALQMFRWTESISRFPADSPECARNSCSPRVQTERVVDGLNFIQPVRELQLEDVVAALGHRMDLLQAEPELVWKWHLRGIFKRLCVLWSRNRSGDLVTLQFNHLRALGIQDLTMFPLQPGLIWSSILNLPLYNPYYG